jgi:hypothetical protein
MIEKDKPILPKPAMATRSFGLVIVVLGECGTNWTVVVS